MTAREKEKAKQDLHRLVDQLPDSELHAVRRFLEFLRFQDDSLLRKLLLSPEDSEPTTPEEDAASEAAWQEYLRGEFVSAEDAKQDLLA
ncbi:MAG: hypothetical protein HYY01_01825 [Chloroflexi bacterium]|nr:hypothetical protein [Chloroflexota bacterium]